MGSPRVVVTGATGFFGRHLVAALAPRHDVFAVALAAPACARQALPASVRWLPADIGHREEVAAAFAAIGRAGGADVVIHLAAHYDFSGQDHPEYERTNVAGTRHVVEAAAALGVGDVIFASSVAACAFPAPGAAITEASPADATTPYARSKRLGERLVTDSSAFRGFVVRFGALFSDWCEFPPLNALLEAWLSDSPRRLLLGGRGESALPYLHVDDAVAFVERLLDRRETLDPSVPLLASPDGATRHRELFAAATAAHLGQAAEPVFVPAPLCAAGVRLIGAVGPLVAATPFEQPWMLGALDRALRVDASLTRQRLDWSPQARLGLVRRLPFLLQSRRSCGAEWQRRNHGALERTRPRVHLEVYARLEPLAGAIAEELTAQFPDARELGPDALANAHRRLLEALASAVRADDREVFAAACRAWAEAPPGASREERTARLDTLAELCARALAQDGPDPSWTRAIHDHVTMTILYGRDAVEALTPSAGR